MASTRPSCPFVSPDIRGGSPTPWIRPWPYELDCAHLPHVSPHPEQSRLNSLACAVPACLICALWRDVKVDFQKTGRLQIPFWRLRNAACPVFSKSSLLSRGGQRADPHRVLLRYARIQSSHAAAFGTPGLPICRSGLFVSLTHSDWLALETRRRLCGLGAIAMRES